MRIRARTVAVACAVVLVMTGCVSAGAVSKKLEVGMTEPQVNALVGSEPQSVSVTTCGTNAPSGPWQCKVYQYKSAWNGLTTLLIHFQQGADGIWHVNDWNAY
jgi:hypothetical protein